MFTNNFIKNIAVALLIAGFITLVPASSALAQKRASYPEVKDITPDAKGCFVRDGKRYCFKSESKSEGKSNTNLKAAPKDPQALKDCFWHVDKNGKKRLACIYYAF